MAGLLSLSLLWSCTGGSNQQEKPVILVSILPQKTFVEKIAGDDFTLSVLIPHGANPTTYTLLPSQMEEISRAAIWFRMGYVGFELSWGNRITETNPAMKIVDLSEGVELIQETQPEIRGKWAGTDPHTWLSPTNVRIMASRILEELIAVRPEKKEEYTARFHQFLEEITLTDHEIKGILETSTGNKFITYHPSLTYFARDYGLIQYSVEQGGKEPTTSHLAQLTEIARNEGIKTIFIQSEFDRELAGVFASEIKGEIIQIWPLNPDWSENLINIARQISEH